MRWTLSTARPLHVNQFTRISLKVRTAFLAGNSLPGQASFFSARKVVQRLCKTKNGKLKPSNRGQNMAFASLDIEDSYTLLN